MRFIKMHGTGNDFVLVATDPALLPETADGIDWGTQAIALADRHFGIGSDGILLLRPSAIAAFRMQMFNPDGSEAEMCGNGIRCVTKYAVENGVLSSRDTDAGRINVETLAGVKTVWPIIGPNGAVNEVRVDMEPPELSPARVPIAMEGHGPVIDHPAMIGSTAFNLTFISMGNPHAVQFLDSPVGDFALSQIGPTVEHHPLFPNRTNFEIVNVLGRDRLRVRVWERGAGLTMACGTGACAVMVAARLKGLVDDTVTIELPGGELLLEWDGSGPVFMTGDVQTVFEGEWAEIRS
jgi:diaminopimelate epimerase